MSGYFDRVYLYVYLYLYSLFSKLLNINYVSFLYQNPSNQLLSTEISSDPPLLRHHSSFVMLLISFLLEGGGS